MGDPDDDAVAQPVPAARTATHQGVRTGLEIIEIFRQAGDVNQALHWQLAEPAEEPEVLDSDHDRVKDLADVVFQVGQQFDSVQLAFGGLGPALGAGAVLGEDCQLVMAALRLLAFEPGRSTAGAPPGRDSDGSAR